MSTSHVRREPEAKEFLINGANLALFDWPGPGSPILFVHATGFHARCWDRVIERLPDYRCLALDVRGHGRSDKLPPYDWPSLGEDLVELARRLGLAFALAAGHSMGGYLLTYAAARLSGAFDRLLLVDPTIGPRNADANRPAWRGHDFASRRRNYWASPEEMYERFHARPPFSLWDPEVLHDYCDYGLLPDPAGEGFILACPPEVESAVYGGHVPYDIYGDVAAVTQPVRVLRARPRTAGIENAGVVDMTGSPTSPELAGSFARGEERFLPEYTHFLPMQAPGVIADEVQRLLGSEAGASTGANPEPAA